MHIYICVMRQTSELLREVVKYYFADFVRKGGSPPPLYGQNFCQQKVTDLGGTPPPLRTFPQKILQKGLKIVFFCFKNKK